MKCPYRAGSEYEYLWECIQDQYSLDVDRLLEPLWQQERYAWKWADDDGEAYESAHSARLQVAQQIEGDRWRRLDNLHWLYLDTQLRQEGKTYPDVYERSD